ncbi:hypothetical protein GVN24_26740 [Rhizobium sp. CRIBSB]|nr:hypothetical protein [Rhizobium sp. CRIBSB]
MSRPDLQSEEGRAAYRKELRQVALPVRWTGLGLIVVAAIWVLAARDGALAGTLIFAYGLLAAGWALVVAGVFMRTRHHRRRMAEIDGGGL